MVLRTSRFFPEEGRRPKDVRSGFADENIKLNEFLYRRVDIEDIVSAHLLAADHAPLGRFRVTSSAPRRRFGADDPADLRTDAPRWSAVTCPTTRPSLRRRGWTMLPGIDRVYVNDRARTELGWQPRYDFRSLIGRLLAARTSAVPSRARSAPRAIMLALHARVLTRWREDAAGNIRWIAPGGCAKLAVTYLYTFKTPPNPGRRFLFEPASFEACTWGRHLAP